MPPAVDDAESRARCDRCARPKEARQHQGIAGIFARRDGGDVQRLVHIGIAGQIFERVHRDIRPAIEQRRLDLFGEESLAADGVQRPIEDLVALGLEHHKLDRLLGSLGEEGAAGVLGLPQRQGRAAGGNTNGRKAMRCSFSLRRRAEGEGAPGPDPSLGSPDSPDSRGGQATTGPAPRTQQIRTATGLATAGLAGPFAAGAGGRTALQGSQWLVQELVDHSIGESADQGAIFSDSPDSRGRTRASSPARCLRLFAQRLDYGASHPWLPGARGLAGARSR